MASTDEILKYVEQCAARECVAVSHSEAVTKTSALTKYLML